MSVIILVAFIWGVSAIVKAAKKAQARRRVEQAQHALAIQRAAQAARVAQIREEYKRQQIVAKQETARLISIERARMEEEKARRIAEARAIEQAQKEAARIQKEAEKARKAAFEREQAEADMEHYEAIRQGYINLYDMLEEELNASTTTEKRRATIQRQLLTLEEKLYRVDQRKAKAYYILKGAC